MCLATNCVAFYYGTDHDSPLKQFRLEAADEGRARGEIDVVFQYGTTQYDRPTWQGLIDDIELDATGNRLRFDFATSTGYGPIHYDLWRCDMSPSQ